MRKKLKSAIIVSLAVGYLAADYWLYKLSQLPLADAVIIDIPVTMGALLLIGVIYRLLSDDQ